MSQLAFDLRDEHRTTILGQPILTKLVLPDLPCVVEVVGGKYAGDTYIYTAHLFGRIARVNHYTGSTNNLPRRLQEHRRTWPTYRLTTGDYEHFRQIDQFDLLKELIGRTFRRKATYLEACRQALGDDMIADYELRLLSAGKKHIANGILMAANQRKIPWTIARVFQADRQLEFALKARKGISRYCPICQGEEVPF